MVNKPNQIDSQQIKGSSPKGVQSLSGNKFNAYLGPAFAETAALSVYQGTGNNNAAAVLHSAFTAFPQASGAFGGGAGYPGAYGTSPGMMGVGSYNSVNSMMGVGGYGTAGGAKYTSTMGSDPYNSQGGVAGTGVGTMELVGSLNESNLQLLELQAVMQSNMQQWTTRSNILSADHRARMSMIEKFTARG
ncbi:hypothetical protein KKA47_07415 [bacterium]|nr:hypothetical protein [bacterium]